MAHRVENSIIELNRPRDEQRRVLWLARHLLGWFWRKLLYLGNLFLNFLYFLWWLCLLWWCWWYAVAFVVFEACAAFGGEGSVQFEERLRI